MRVQESKQSGKTSNMVKKKHKLRKQAKENELCPSDSSDDGGNAGRCPHISKGINFNVMRKALKQVGSVGECTTCDSAQSSHKTDTKQDDSSLGGATGGAKEVIMDGMLFEEEEPTIWVCLQCGHQGCDRNSKEQHALKHFQTPRSNLHALVVNVNTWVVWCYSCDDEVLPDNSRKLQECVEFVKKMASQGATSSGPSSLSTCSVNRSGSFKGDVASGGDQPQAESAAKVEIKPTKPKPISLQAAAGVTQGLPKVKGLSNLGNTCFFNAVMQNLSQTYILDTMLSENGTKGAVISLPGRKASLDLSDDPDAAVTSSSESEEDSDKQRVELAPFSVTLGDPGALTLSLISFMRDMHNPGKVNTISPSNLFGQVCKKAPRFKAFQQQDSHELLRHLLDGMKAEEIKRSQTAILKQFHLAENTNPKNVDEDTKLKVKEYGRQAKHTFVDSTFGGVFISTVLCEECRVPSQVFEPFLDISLPVLEEKTVRPNNMWSWRKKDDTEKPKTTTTTAMDELVATADRGPSKHQLKKAKRQAKRDSKKKIRETRAKTSSESTAASTGRSEEKANDGEKTQEASAKTTDTGSGNADSRSPSDQDLSDADIEDNIESDTSRTRLIGPITIEDADKNDSPTEGRGLQSVPSEASASCSSINCSHNERSDSTGRSEESTLTEASAGESKTGCSTCNSVASLSDSTCKASSIESPFGSNTGLNEVADPPAEPQGDQVKEVTEGLDKLKLDDSESATIPDTKKRDSFHEKECKADVISGGSLDGTEETASTSNGNHGNSSSHRSRSSGYSSGPPSSKATSTATTVCSRSQRRLEAKFKAMSCLGSRYQPLSQECSVQSCLNQFTAAELLTGSNKFGCETCTKRKHSNSTKEGKKDTVYTNASKQVLVFQPPAILTLHLKRFQQVGFTLRKVNRHVDFPMLLDLAPFCSSLSKGVSGDQSRVLYSLYGVVEHSGRLTGGHYTAYVKVRPKSSKLRDFIQNHDTVSFTLDRLLETLHSSQQDLSEKTSTNSSSEGQDTADIGPTPGKWYYISDSRVSEVSSEASVLRCQAYLLFYERIL